MVTFVAGAPSAPRNLKITPVSTGVSRLLWTSPLSSSRQPVTSYATRISPDSGRTWSTWTNRSGKVHQALLTGCAQGATCIVQIHALNRFGVGISSSIRFIQRI
jgi:hypothetical protein